MKKQLLDLQKYLAQKDLDIAYISNPTDIQYFTGFYSEPVERILALLVFPDKDPFLFAPQLEVESAKKAGWDQDVFGYLDHEKPFDLIALLRCSATNNALASPAECSSCEIFTKSFSFLNCVPIFLLLWFGIINKFLIGLKANIHNFCI